MDLWIAIYNGSVGSYDKTKHILGYGLSGRYELAVTPALYTVFN